LRGFCFLSYKTGSNIVQFPESTFNTQENKLQLQVSINNLYYLKEKRLPGVPLDVFFGIKAQDNEGLKSEISKIVFLYIPPIVP
jgi:predicted transglutaminase-like protease